MARNLDKCRLCRRAGEKLFLKGSVAFPKCAMVRKAYAPGVHGKMVSRGQKRIRESSLCMKQRIKRIYGVLEKQFPQTLRRCESSQEGVAGDFCLPA